MQIHRILSIQWQKVAENLSKIPQYRKLHSTFFKTRYINSFLTVPSDQKIILSIPKLASFNTFQN